MDLDRCELLCLDLERAEALRQRRPLRSLTESVALRGHAFGDPLRVEVAMALAEEELCVCDLAWIVGRSHALVGHHVRVLRRAGLVVGRKDKKMLMCRISETGRALLDQFVSAGVRS